MADTKISALTALTGANVEQLADVLPIVDTSLTTTKKILVSELAQAMLVLGTEQASTAGTAINFTSIPAWVKRITINFVGVSTNGTSEIIVQIGDSGGLETSNYLGAAADIGGTRTNFTTGYGLTSGNAAGAVYHGTVTIALEDSANFTWVATGILARSDGPSVTVGGGSKSLSAALTSATITMVNGTDAFDAGAINVLLE